MLNNELICSLSNYGINNFDAILSDIQDIGFNCVEIDSGQSIPLSFSPERLFNFSFSKELKKDYAAYDFCIPDLEQQINHYNLKTSIINASCELCHPRSVEILERRIEMAHLMHVPMIITGVGHGSEIAFRRKNAIDNLRMVCDYAKQYNIIICLKTDGWLTDRSSEVLEVIKVVSCENLKIDFDPANILYFKEDIDINAYLKEIIEYIGCMHIRGSSGKRFDKKFPDLKNSIINYKSIFDILADSNFKGQLCLALENSYLWEPDTNTRPLTWACWQNKSYDRDSLEKKRYRIMTSLEHIKSIISTNQEK